jgi:hypothetical protein
VRTVGAVLDEGTCGGPGAITAPTTGEEDDMRSDPFTTIERAFNKLVASDALAIDGSLHPGLPGRQVPISEIVIFLRSPQSPQEACDSIWRAFLTFPDRERWDLICFGLALPALRKAATRASRIWPHDPEGIQAEALDAFIREIHQADHSRDRIFSTVCNHVKSACRTYARDLARHARGLQEITFESRSPAEPWSHIDLVLLRAVEQEVISLEEGSLIAACRLEDVSTETLAKALGVSRLEVTLTRKGAEQRLADWILNEGS